MREYKGYPRTKASGVGAVKPRKVTICRAAVAGDLLCRKCGHMHSKVTDQHRRVTEDIYDGILAGADWTIMCRYCRYCGTQQTSTPEGVLPGEY